MKMGYIPRNPALAVDHLPMHEAKAQKETFSPEEIAKLLAVPSDDWQGVILLEALAGMRRWGNVDLQAGAITFTPSKTARLGKKLTLPIHPERRHFCHSAPMETHAFGFRLRANAPEGQKRFPISISRPSRTDGARGGSSNHDDEFHRHPLPKTTLWQ
jgi:integrase